MLAGPLFHRELNPAAAAAFVNAVHGNLPPAAKHGRVVPIQRRIEIGRRDHINFVSNFLAGHKASFLLGILAVSRPKARETRK
jgi:hypothetical protein